MGDSPTLSFGGIVTGEQRDRHEMSDESGSREYGAIVQDAVDESQDEEGWTPSECPWCDTDTVVSASEAARCLNCEREFGPDDICDDCEGHMVSRDGEEVCQSCGMLSDTEQQFYSNHKSKLGGDAERTGSAHYDFERPSMTAVDESYTKSWDTMLSPRQSARAKRLERMHKQSLLRSKRERSREHGMQEIQRMISALGLATPVEENARVLFIKAHERDLLYGRTIEGIASACVLFAARMESVPQKISEVAAVSRVEELHISRVSRILKRRLSLSIDPNNPHDFLSRYASDLDVDRDVVQSARSMVDCVDTSPLLSNRSAASVASAALFAASLAEAADRLSQNEIAEATDVSVGAISETYQLLLDECRPS